MDIFVYSLSIPFFPSILVELAGQDQGGIYFGISQSVGNAMAMFSGVISGYLSDKFSRKAAVFLSQLFAGVCCLLIANWDAFCILHSNPYCFVWPVTLLGKSTAHTLLW